MGSSMKSIDVETAKKLAWNLQRTADITRALFKMKFGLYRKLFPGLSDVEIARKITWDIVARKDAEWE